MRISWNWLRTLIETDLSPHEAAAILTSTGLEVESVELLEPVRGMLAGVVVGQVLGCEKHPDADRLRVCQVELGSGTPVAIVCGAPNVAEGQRVLVATVGTTLHPSAGEPITIKRSKIRGVESNGMICAEDELGLGSGHAGILVLDPSAVVGTAAAVLLGLRVDHALEIGLTPNRADAMSHVGVARDLAAALTVRTGRPVAVKWPDTSAFRMGEGTGIPVEVLAPAACSRYAGITLSNVKVASSPAWLQERLRSIGLKPINNVVDVTNFVQHELGQPLHAFDAARLAGGRVVVRLAKEGEPFRTLDGKDRLLSAQDLVIADAEKPACLAGVFGGADSGVGPDTTKVFLESARFDPATVRKTARRHGLNTDASFRFERGVDPGITITALQRAVLLLCELTGARVQSEVQEVQQMEAPWATVELDPRRVQRAIGVEVPAEEIVQVLRALDCRVQASGDDRWQV
ncbi:MAG: phenylalanine--tRNA ligase subunit beta, partial [Flavobacteriales bacterium]|nr:phenylalanine--tRNA ligase subunit beta [Flavobacteriales bacterium]